MIKQIGQFWFIVNAGAFHGYPWPTRQDAEEALQAVLAGSTIDMEINHGTNANNDFDYAAKDQHHGGYNHWDSALLPSTVF